MTASSDACRHPRVSNACVLERAIFYDRSTNGRRDFAYGKEKQKHPRGGKETRIPSGLSSLLCLHLAHFAEGENIADKTCLEV